ncbi:MarR family winged helix-turn-helix transcriptional regulator [Alteromonas lipolytica]|uniref:HTH marR-type domain-containing protein n=1 Tax=Alteromonas lipolytica TaxID=1856405 RepID=A0A1E8FAJ6_9ALTE|nr:MarR family transcriptional regulator [Alteromonas lipolytica]OFI32935.1 hypothetical protein BFC17_01265 [Alteromonas lipolytica]GGF64100.1 hypothetical protein GCM10011338_15560 [Alteromonas lipolytica]
MQSNAKAFSTKSKSGFPDDNAISGLMSHIGVKLASTASVYVDLYRQRLRQINLTPSRVLALSIIYENPGLVQKSLAEALGVNQASVMAVINKLQAAGFVKRVEGDDKRSKAVYITAMGETNFNRSLTIEQELSGEILGDFTQAEQTQFATMLDKIRVRCEQQEIATLPEDISQPGNDACSSSETTLVR